MSVTTVAVTKTFPFDAIVKAYGMGFRHIGENRVSEAEGKIHEAKRQGMHDIVWHMVGHVQSRKASKVAELFDWVDSVDSVAIARKLSGAAGKLGKKLHILLEVNLTGEKTKYGFDNRRLFEQINEIMKLPNLIVEGLMTMPPLVHDPQDNRAVFRSMRTLSETIRVRIPVFGSELSMGTSQDYQAAIEEGATQVRLGEALFGPRQ